MAKLAKTVAEVVAGEATRGTAAERYEDMLAISSVIDNRSRLLGITPEQVVANQREFNAYNSPLPSGTLAYVDMAQNALADVRVNGPRHTGVFYATPPAVKNLKIEGLKQVAQTKGHKYFSDPQNRAIGTALGLKRPDPKQLQFQGPVAAPTLTAANVPRPTAAPRAVAPTARPAPPSTMSALNAAPRPTSAMAALNAALSRPTAPAASPVRSSLMGVTGSPRSMTPSAPARSMPSRPVSPTPQNMPAGVMSRMDMSPAFSPAPRSAPVPASVSARMAPTMTAMDQAMAARPTTALGMARAPVSMPSRPVSPTPQRESVATRMDGFGPTALKGMSPAQALAMDADDMRVASKLSSMSPRTPNVPSQPTPTRTAQVVGPAAPVSAGNTFSNTLGTLGRAMGVAPAAAAVNSPVSSLPQSKPVSTGFAGALGSPRSMEATMGGPLAANRFSPAPTKSVPVSSLPTRTASLPAPMQASMGPSLTRAAPAPATNFAGAVGSPRAVAASARVFQSPAFSTPRIDTLGQPPIAGLQRALPTLSAPVSVAPSPKVASLPQRAAPVASAPRAAPTVTAYNASPAARNVQSTGLGLPSVPSAPTQFGGLGGLGGYLSANRGMLAGGVLGSAVAGPIGGLLGGYIGARIQGGGGGTPSNAAQAAAEAGWDGFSGMTSAQEAAARGAGSGSSGSKGSSGKSSSSKSSGSSGKGGGIGPGGGGARDSASR